MRLISKRPATERHLAASRSVTRGRKQGWGGGRVLSVLASSAMVLGLVGANTVLNAGSGPAGASSPALTVSENSIDFGSVTLGDFKPAAFVITNTSTSVDTISALTEFIAPGPAFLFGPTQGSCQDSPLGTITLSSGESCTATFDFEPNSLGPASATLNIEDSLNSDESVSMSGTGVTGYYQVASKGDVINRGDAANYGTAASFPLIHPIVGIAPTGDDGGYWLAASDGGVFSYGNAKYFGSTGALALKAPIVGISATDDAEGYCLVAADGGVFNYGDAPFEGSTGDLTLNAPIVGMAHTSLFDGYWLVASDGGVFAFGFANFFGSMGGMHLNAPIVGMAPAPDNKGYWLVASDGGVFAFGSAKFFGSTGSLHLNQPIVAMSAMPDGNGYWLSAADGGLFNYGDAPFEGSSVGMAYSGKIVAMANDGLPTFQGEFGYPALKGTETPSRLLNGKRRDSG